MRREPQHTDFMTSTLAVPQQRRAQRLFAEGPIVQSDPQPQIFRRFVQRIFDIQLQRLAGGGDEWWGPGRLQPVGEQRQPGCARPDGPREGEHQPLQRDPGLQRTPGPHPRRPDTDQAQRRQGGPHRPQVEHPVRRRLPQAFLGPGDDGLAQIRGDDIICTGRFSQLRGGRQLVGQLGPVTFDQPGQCHITEGHPQGTQEALPGRDDPADDDQQGERHPRPRVVQMERPVGECRRRNQSDEDDGQPRQTAHRDPLPRTATYVVQGRLPAIGHERRGLMRKVGDGPRAIGSRSRREACLRDHTSPERFRKIHSTVSSRTNPSSTSQRFHNGMAVSAEIGTGFPGGRAAINCSTCQNGA